MLHIHSILSASRLTLAADNSEGFHPALDLLTGIWRTDATFLLGNI